MTKGNNFIELNYSVLGQEPITRSLHTYCTLESTLSRIFLVLELWRLQGH